MHVVKAGLIHRHIRVRAGIPDPALEHPAQPGNGNAADFDTACVQVPVGVVPPQTVVSFGIMGIVIAWDPPHADASSEHGCDLLVKW